MGAPHCLPPGAVGFGAGPAPGCPREPQGQALRDPSARVFLALPAGGRAGGFSISGCLTLAGWGLAWRGGGVGETINLRRQAGLPGGGRARAAGAEAAAVAPSGSGPGRGGPGQAGVGGARVALGVGTQQEEGPAGRAQAPSGAAAGRAAGRAQHPGSGVPRTSGPWAASGRRASAQAHCQGDPNPGLGSPRPWLPARGSSGRPAAGFWGAVLAGTAAGAQVRRWPGPRTPEGACLGAPRPWPS